MRKSKASLNDEAAFELALEEERLILEATELIESLLADQGINRKQLADRLGKSKAHVTQLLSGERNLTLRTLAEVAYHLGARVHVGGQSRIEAPRDWYVSQRPSHGSYGRAVPNGGVRRPQQGWKTLNRDTRRLRVVESTATVNLDPAARRNCAEHGRDAAAQEQPSRAPWFDMTGERVNLDADDLGLCRA